MSKIKIKINTLSGLLFGIAILFIAVLGFTPKLRLGTHYYYLLTGGLVILTMGLSSNTEGFRQNKSLIVNICAYLLMVLCYKFFNISTASTISVFRHIFFFIPILLMPLIPDIVSNRKKLLWIMIGLILYVVLDNVIDNIRLCLKHPEIFLFVNRDMLVEDMEGLGNIGGSQWYNSIFFFYLTCIFTFLTTGNKFVKVIMLVCSILSAIFLLFFCLKAAIIVFTILSFLLLLYAERIKSMYRMVWSLILVYLIVILFVGFYSTELIEMLESMISSDRLLSRLTMLIDPESAEASEGSGTVSARGELWMVSINTWLSNPVYFLFGVGDTPTMDYSLIGHHSDILDSFARYGLVGSLLVFNSLRMSYKYILSLYREKEKSQLFVMAMVFVLFGVTKGVFNPAIGCSLFLLLPFLSYFIKEEPQMQSIDKGVIIDK